MGPIKNKTRLAGFWGRMSKVILSAVSGFLFIFSLVSGAESRGRGVMGVIKGIILNSPNAFPWLVLLFVVYLSWRKELLGGTLIFLFGLFTMLFFNTARSLFVFMVASFPFLSLGPVLILSRSLAENKGGLN